MPESEQTKVLLHELGHVPQTDYAGLYNCSKPSHYKMEAEATEYMLKEEVETYLMEMIWIVKALIRLFSWRTGTYHYAMPQWSKKYYWKYKKDDLLMNIYDRIKALADTQKISIRRLEENIGFGNGTINRWRKNTPGVDKLSKVADYFKVSTDYLLGRTDDKTALSPKEMSDIGQLDDRMLDGAEERLRNNIVNLRESRNWSQKELATRLGIDSSYISKIESGNRKVSTSELDKISSLFNVTTDYLLGRPNKQETKKDDVELSDDDVIMTWRGKPLSDEDRELIRRIMNGK